MVSSGSVTDWSDGKDPTRDAPDLEVQRDHCRFCQAPKPNLQGWVYVADGAFWEAP